MLIPATIIQPGPTAFQQLYDNTAGGAIGSWDVSGISQAFSHLKIYMLARGDTAAANARAQIRFNNDSTAIYDYERAFFSAAGPLGMAEGLAQTSGEFAVIPAASVAAGMFGQAEMAIVNYPATVAQKMMTTTSSDVEGTATGTINIWYSTVRWRSTAAINRITVFPVTGNFIAGSRLSIYGIL